MERECKCKLDNNIKWYITHVRQCRSQKKSNHKYSKVWALYSFQKCGQRMPNEVSQMHEFRAQLIKVYSSRSVVKPTRVLGVMAVLRFSYGSA